MQSLHFFRFPDSFEPVTSFGGSRNQRATVEFSNSASHVTQAECEISAAVDSLSPTRRLANIPTEVLADVGIETISALEEPNDVRWEIPKLNAEDTPALRRRISPFESYETLVSHLECQWSQT
jgi:hypothetical protein